MLDYTNRVAVYVLLAMAAHSAAQLTTRLATRSMTACEHSQTDTTEGRITSASSDSKPFNFLQNHPLISVDRNGVGWDYFDSVNMYQYNLQHLLTQLQVAPTLSTAQVICSEGCNCYPIAWVKSIFDNAYQYDGIKLSCTADIVVKAFENILVPFLASVKNRPDGVVLCEFKQWNVPIFILEVHSSPYKYSVAKTAVDVIDQLRLLRCFDANISKCVGFTFPKFSKDNIENKTCVTKVTVSFKDFKFCIHLSPLQISNVKSEIQEVVQGTKNFLFRYNPFLCFMRLSQKDKMEIAGTFCVHPSKVEQVETRHCIILKTDDTFWKYIPRLSEFVNYGLFLEDMKIKCVKPKHMTLPSGTTLHEGLMFYVFPSKIPPLTKSEAEQCLCDLITKTATALQELHNLGYAHLDVRLPNICFTASNRADNDVTLIDLDRVISIKHGSVEGYIGEMYNVPHQWLPSQCDWKQLGLLTASVLFKLNNHSLIVKDPRVDKNECLKQLIKEGVWDKTACVTTIVNGLSLHQVLQGRSKSIPL